MVRQMSNDPVILVELENAGFSRDGKWMVRGVEFSVRKGEIVTLVGPNGSGKSTTAKLALGIIKPDEGQINRRANLRTSYVPQKLEIDQTLPLSVERFMRLTSSLSNQALGEALQMTGASHLEKSNVQTLSGGEFQRVMLARAIARKPDLLVLDEPVQGVDFNGEIALYELIVSIRDELDCGIIMISHDLHVVMAATDSVICLNGHVCCRGTPKIVAESEEYRALFGGRASSMLAFYEHQHDHTHLPDGRVQHLDGSTTDHCYPGDGHHHGASDDA